MTKKLFFIFILPVIALVGVWFLRGAFATSNPHTWTNGLVGYWSFDGQYTTSTSGTRDVSGNNNWGTFNGGVSVAGGISGQSLSFDGVNDYVDIGTPTALNITGNALSLEAWVKVSSWSKTDVYAAIIENYQIATGGYLLEKDDVNSRFFFGVWTAGGWKAAVPGDTLSENVWYHIVGVFDGTSINYYVNGVNKARNTFSATTISSSANPVRIGARSSSANRFNGLVDEVRIYNRVLSADEIKQHYDQTKRNFIVSSSSSISTSGLVGYWNFDGTNTTTTSGASAGTRDASGNNNWGTFNGGVKVAGGVSGQALSFDGVDDYVNVGSGTGLMPDVFTVEAWIKYNSGTFWPLISWGDVVPLVAPVWTAGSSIIYLGLSNYQYFNNPGNLTDKNWHHMVFVVTGNGQHDIVDSKVYVDGISLTSSSHSHLDTSAAKVGPIYIGKRGSQYTNGSIDEVRIYNRALSADEVKQHYDQTKRNFIVSSSSSISTNGLVGYWNFDGTNTTTTSGASAGTRDASGNNNWGTFNGGVKVAGGVSGQALSFDGVNDYVGIGSSSTLSMRLGSQTFEAWVKFNSISTRLETIVYCGAGRPGTGNDGYWIGRNTNNRLYITFADGTTERLAQYLTLTDSINNISWHHLVVVFNRTSNAIAYVDGKLQSQNLDISSQQGDVTNVSSCGIGSASGYYFNGLLDEVRIYNRALSADEVMQHYQQTRRNLTL